MRSSDPARAVVLLSGGLDSTVSLAAAFRELEIRLILFFNYGQRALSKERQAVLAIASYYSLPLREVDLAWLHDISPKGMRISEEATSASGSGNSHDVNELCGLESVWIPNRNGVFLNVAASFAESYGCEYIITGFNAEEAVSFPDNRREYVARLNRGLALSTLNGVRVLSFTQDLRKSEIIELGSDLSAPLSNIWSCYKDGDLMCGICASCLKLKGALQSVAEEKRPVMEFAE